jgi:heat shock protein HslJ
MKTVIAAIVPVFLLVMVQFPLNLKKQRNDVPLQGTRWNLIALSNQLVPVNATSKDMFLILKSDSTATGNGGCNAFSGNYSLGKDNEISFGDMVRTNVLCAGIDFERKYLNALAKADHYNVDGDTLTLKNQMINLAKFVARK